LNPLLLDYLCDPRDKSPLTLRDPQFAPDGSIVSGLLISGSGRSFPIRDGVPRFAEPEVQRSVVSFGDEWNHFNFDEFRINWLEHTVRHTFGSLAEFKDKLVVDCGAGSGIQSRWISEAGARHVIALELSHSVDDVMKRNLAGMRNVDIVQCSIDAPPLRDASINGMVICHNVIQHTPSVENTARALWRLVGNGGEFIFNCYPKNDQGLLRKLRFQFYLALRAFFVRRSFGFLLAYSRIMAALRLVPLLGWLLEKSLLVIRGDVPAGPNYLRRAYRSAALNTFDCYGSHSYQHMKTDDEIRALVAELQPDPARVLNMERYFLRPQPVGIALRLKR
jgi:ubiquinone/menaquinone biosynthesis C-methylase UbiE